MRCPSCGREFHWTQGEAGGRPRTRCYVCKPPADVVPLREWEPGPRWQEIVRLRLGVTPNPKAEWLNFR